MKGHEEVMEHCKLIIFYYETEVTNFKFHGKLRRYRKVWRYQKSKKDRQYNGHNGQRYKQWTTKHYTENNILYPELSFLLRYAYLCSVAGTTTMDREWESNWFRNTNPTNKRGWIEPREYTQCSKVLLNVVERLLEYLPM